MIFRERRILEGQFVEEVDEEVPDEHLETRIDETFDNRAEPSSD